MSRAAPTRARRRLILKAHWLFLVGAVALALRFVPGFPRFYLDDPNRWAVAACVVVIAVMLLRGWRSRGVEPHVHALTAILMALPLVYVADWIRFGGSALWLLVELLGVALFWGFAWAAVKKGPRFLAWGIGIHAGWDLMHFGASEYVPDWYVIACVIIDVALALVTLLLIRESVRRGVETDADVSGQAVHAG